MTSAEDNGAAAAAEALTTMESAVQNVGRFTLSNGITLEFRHVSPQAMRMAMQSVERPEPPVVEIEAKGRSEPNPNHPDYIEALGEYIEAASFAGQAVAFMLGIEPVEIPESLYPIEADTWIEEIEAVWAISNPDAGLTIPRANDLERKLSWLRFYAIASDEDMFVCTRMAMQKIGLMEDEVAEALDSFRSGADGGTDPVIAATTGSVDGDHVRDPDPGDGAGS